MIPIEPERGTWTLDEFPPRIIVRGRKYHRAQWSFPYPGVVMQYREAVPRNSRHLFVYRDGHYCVNHLDETNPDMASPVHHFLRDVLKV